MWREEWRERQRKEAEQVKRMCEDKLQAIVRENEATAQMVKIKHELENMAREEKELEVMYLEEVREMEPESRKEIYLEEEKELEVMYLEEVKEMEPERRKEIYLE